MSASAPPREGKGAETWAGGLRHGTWMSALVEFLGDRQGCLAQQRHSQVRESLVHPGNGPGDGNRRGGRRVGDGNREAADADLLLFLIDRIAAAADQLQVGEQGLDVA